MRAKGKYILVLLSFWLVPFALKAQEENRRWSVSAGYGVMPIQMMFNNFLSFSSVEWETTRVVGPMQVGLSYALTQKIELGLVYSKITIEEEGRDRGASSQTPGPGDGSVVSRTRERHSSLMPFVQLKWKTTPKMIAYSGYAQGWSRSTTADWPTGGGKQTSTNRNFAFQVTAVGVRYGKRVAGFFEVGFGVHGILNGGLTVQL